MTEVWCHMIFGANPEPFLEAALRSVDWVDRYTVVNTAPGDEIAQQNEETVLRTVPHNKLTLSHVQMDEFDFAKARNISLDRVPNGVYILLVDADDVHWPEFEEIARDLINQGYDIITGHFWHHIGYKDLWGEEPHREILFKKTSGVRFERSVHEALAHPRVNPTLAGTYHWNHYGYIKPPQEIFKRWVLYSELEGDPHHYDGRSPDDALAGWLESCQPFWREHPPAVQPLLESYPSAPRSARAIDTPRNVGLVLLTWNDAENLRACLTSLKYTRQPFKLCVVDNNSTDQTRELVDQLIEERLKDPQLGGPEGDMIFWPPAFGNYSLAKALNVGFQHWMEDPEIDYIGWIHPDMVFERDTWLECLRHALDTHPDIVKAGAAEMDSARSEEPWPGNTQCYLVRKSALAQTGLFDEDFEACGGYEDWELNARLLKLGRIMVWPDALIRHNAMGTRRNHDNVEAARRNAERYHEKVGMWGPLV